MRKVSASRSEKKQIGSHELSNSLNKLRAHPLVSRKSAWRGFTCWYRCLKSGLHSGLLVKRLFPDRELAATAS